MAEIKPLILNVNVAATERAARSAALRLANIDVIETGDSPTAMDLLEQRRPTLLLLDAMTPNFDGIDVGLHVKAAWPDIIVIRILDASGTLGMEINDADRSADCCLTAPLDARELVAVTRAMLRLRAVEIQAKQNNERYRRVLDTAEDCAILTCGADGRITSWSAGAETIFGYNQVEIIGKTHNCIFTEEDIANDRPGLWLDAVCSGLQVRSAGWHRRRDGSLFWSTSRTVPLRDCCGQIGGYLKILHDQSDEHASRNALIALNADLEERISDRTQQLAATNQKLVTEIAERERTAEQLWQTQKIEAIGRLTAGIAHDFNNLLTAIMGGLEVLRLRNTDPRTVRILDSTMNAAQRGAKLIAQLTAFAGKQKLSAEPVDVNRLINDMWDELVGIVGPAVKLSLALDPQAWLVLADVSQVRIALLNLSVNARDTMQTGGVLTISTGNEVVSAAASGPTLLAGDYGMLCVRDDGQGLSDDALAHLFEPFFTTKDVGKGSGLDLAQVYGFVRQSGGDIRVSSRSGEGTSLTILLPRAANGPPGAARQQPDEPDAQASE